MERAEIPHGTVSPASLQLPPEAPAPPPGPSTPNTPDRSAACRGRPKPAVSHMPERPKLFFYKSLTPQWHTCEGQGKEISPYLAWTWHLQVLRPGKCQQVGRQMPSEGHHETKGEHAPSASPVAVEPQQGPRGPQ